MLPYDTQLTPRDRAILRTLVECRLATYTQLAQLHFEGRLEAAKKRAQKLIAGGYLTQRPRRVSEPVILHLTGKALKLMLSEGLMERYPRLASQDITRRAKVSDATIKHELAVMDLRCAMTTGLRPSPTYRIAEFSTWPLLHSFHAQIIVDAPRILIRPDGYLRIAESREDHQTRSHAFFLELDRGTESLDTLVNRCLGYRQFYQSSGYAKWHGGSRDQFERYPFRVLIVVTNEERRNNLADQLLRVSPPILGMVWIAVTDAALGNPFGSIWMTPADYRAAVDGTVFAIQRETQTGWYRRQVHREIIVRQRIAGRSLLAQ
jgi:hypothetical protein